MQAVSNEYGCSSTILEFHRPGAVLHLEFYGVDHVTFNLQPSIRMLLAEPGRQDMFL
jgi:hypothetical protein